MFTLRQGEAAAGQSPAYCVGTGVTSGLSYPCVQSRARPTQPGAAPLGSTLPHSNLGPSSVKSRLLPTTELLPLKWEYNGCLCLSPERADRSLPYEQPMGRGPAWFSLHGWHSACGVDNTGLQDTDGDDSSPASTKHKECTAHTAIINHPTRLLPFSQPVSNTVN